MQCQVDFGFQMTCILSMLGNSPIHPTKIDLCQLPNLPMCTYKYMFASDEPYQTGLIIKDQQILKKLKQTTLQTVKIQLFLILIIKHALRRISDMYVFFSTLTLLPFLCHSMFA